MPAPAAHIPRVPLNMAAKKITGIKITVLFTLAVLKMLCELMNFSGDNFFKATTKTEGKPSNKNIGKEWESGNKENTLSESWSPK